MKIEYKVEWTPDIIGEVLLRVKDFVEKHPSGEHIMQSDEAQIDSIELLSDIADLIKPSKWETQES